MTRNCLRCANPTTRRASSTIIMSATTRPSFVCFLVFFHLFLFIDSSSSVVQPETQHTSPLLVAKDETKSDQEFGLLHTLTTTTTTTLAHTAATPTTTRTSTIGTETALRATTATTLDETTTTIANTTTTEKTLAKTTKTTKTTKSGTTKTCARKSVCRFPGIPAHSFAFVVNQDLEQENHRVIFSVSHLPSSLSSKKTTLAETVLSEKTVLAKKTAVAKKTVLAKKTALAKKTVLAKKTTPPPFLNVVSPESTPKKDSCSDDETENVSDVVIHSSHRRNIRSKRMTEKINENARQEVDEENDDGEKFWNDWSSMKFIGIRNFSSVFESSTKIGFMCESTFFKLMALQKICFESLPHHFDGDLAKRNGKNKIHLKNNKVRSLAQNLMNEEMCETLFGDDNDDSAEVSAENDDDDDDVLVDDDEVDQQDFNDYDDNDDVSTKNENTISAKNNNNNNKKEKNVRKTDPSSSSCLKKIVNKSCVLKNEEIFYHTAYCNCDGEWENLHPLMDKSFMCQPRLMSNLFSFETVKKNPLSNSWISKGNLLDVAWTENTLSFVELSNSENNDKNVGKNDDDDFVDDDSAKTAENDSGEKNDENSFDKNSNEEVSAKDLDLAKKEEEVSAKEEEEVLDLALAGEEEEEEECKKNESLSNKCKRKQHQKLKWSVESLPVFFINRIAFVIEGAVLGNTILVYKENLSDDKKYCHLSNQYSLGVDDVSSKDVFLRGGGHERNEKKQTNMKKKKKYLEYQCEGLNFWSVDDIYLLLTIPGSVISDLSVYSDDVVNFLDPYFKRPFLSQSLCGLPRFSRRTDVAFLDVYNGHAVGMKFQCSNTTTTYSSPGEHEHVHCVFSSEFGRWGYFNYKPELCCRFKNCNPTNHDTVDDERHEEFQLKKKEEEEFQLKKEDGESGSIDSTSLSSSSSSNELLLENKLDNQNELLDRNDEFDPTENAVEVLAEDDETEQQQQNRGTIVNCTLRSSLPCLKSSAKTAFFFSYFQPFAFQLEYHGGLVSVLTSNFVYCCLLFLVFFLFYCLLMLFNSL